MDYNKIYQKKDLIYRFKSVDVPELLKYFEKKAGWVYIAQSQDNNFLKIGRTSKPPLQRAKSLSSTGVFNDYTIAFSLQVFNQFIIEKNIHKALSSFRVGKEFFNTTLSHAISVMEKEVVKEEQLLNKYFDLPMLKEDINLLPYALKN